MVVGLATPRRPTVSTNQFRRRGPNQCPPSMVGYTTTRLLEGDSMAVFRVADRRTRRGTHDMIMAMAKYSNHGIKGDYGHPFKTDADVKRYFEEDGYNYRDVVDFCRNKDEHVPGMENLI